MKLLETKQIKIERYTFRIIMSIFGLFYSFFSVIKYYTDYVEFLDNGHDSLASTAITFLIIMTIFFILFIVMSIVFLKQNKALPNNYSTLVVYEDKVVKHKGKKETIVEFKNISRLIDKTEIFGRITMQSNDPMQSWNIHIYNCYDVDINEIYKILNKQYVNLND